MGKQEEMYTVMNPVDRRATGPSESDRGATGPSSENARGAAAISSPLTAIYFNLGESDGASATAGQVHSKAQQEEDRYIIT